MNISDLQCDASCGGGVQRRSVSCRNSNWTRPSSICFDPARPLERRSCNENECDGSVVRAEPESLLRERLPLPLEAPDNDSVVLDPSSWDANYKPRTRLTTTTTTTTVRPSIIQIRPTTSQSLIEPNEEPDGKIVVRTFHPLWDLRASDAIRPKHLPHL